MFQSVIYQDFFGTAPIRAIFHDSALVDQWLHVLKTLAETQAELGIIPHDAASEIAQAARLEHIDLERLRDGTNSVGRAIAPLLKQIEQAGTPAVAEYLHWGSTTQDIMDTATVLQVQVALQIISSQLGQLIELLAKSASYHRSTVMIARTNGQQATPTTFGLHLAGYMLELHRHEERLDELLPRVTVGQLGGAVGTLAAMGTHGLAVRDRLMQKLGLHTPILSWNGGRDNLAEVITMLGLIHGTLGRIATDMNNLSRTEIGEVSEGSVDQQSGSSSTMPHKHNPRSSEVIGGLAQMARIRLSGAAEIMAHTDTRQGSPWIVEWSLIPEMFSLTAAALARTDQLFTHLRVHVDRMLANIQLSRDFAMSETVMMHVAKQIGRRQAYSLVKSAIAQAGPEETLRDIILEDGALMPLVGDHLDRLLDPASAIGFAPQMVDEAVKYIQKT